MVDTLTTLHLRPRGGKPARTLKLRVAFPREQVLVLRASTPSAWGDELNRPLAEEICTELSLRFALDPERVMFIYERVESNQSQLIKLNFDVDFGEAGPILQNCHSGWLSPDLEKEIEARLSGRGKPIRRWDPSARVRRERDKNRLVGALLGAGLSFLLTPFLAAALHPWIAQLDGDNQAQMEQNRTLVQIQEKIDRIDRTLEAITQTPTITNSLPTAAPRPETTGEDDRVAPPIASPTSPLPPLVIQAPEPVAPEPTAPEPTGPTGPKADNTPAPPPAPQSTEIDNGDGAPTVITVEPSSSRPVRNPP